MEMIIWGGKFVVTRGLGMLWSVTDIAPKETQRVNQTVLDSASAAIRKACHRRLGRGLLIARDWISCKRPPLGLAKVRKPRREDDEEKSG